MCTSLGREEESSQGLVLRLCPSAQTDLPTELGFTPRVPKTGGSGARKQTEFVGPIGAVINAFNASTAIVEFEYFDLDYRSEFTVINQTSFAVDYPLATRIHFFDGHPPQHGVYLHDAAGVLSDQYLGYITIRETSPPSVGRSVICPRKTISAILCEPTTLQDHIRTAVDEYVDLFGIQLRATGVPFMEQDGRLLRCAHVTAWMAHYSAVLRGLVARRPSAEFNSTEVPQSYGRSYPSDGLSLMAQSMILSRLDMPPEVLAGDDLLRKLTISWHHRPELAQAIRESDSADRAILIENLTSTICRYLNSGMPVILNRNDRNHSVLVCGYLRWGDLAPESRPARTLGQSDVVGLVVQDDQKGPYQVVMVNDVIDSAQVAGDANDFEVDLSIVVPLPRGLWLSGAAAEAAAGMVFAKTVRQRLAVLSRRGRHGLSFSERRATLKRLQEIGRAVEAKEPGGQFTLRSYALSSSDFKYDFCRRITDVRAKRIVGVTPMSKYVWVVELLDRTLRERRRASIHGTVIFDGTAVSEDGVERAPDPLLIQIPGQIAAIYDSGLLTESSWIPTTSDPYRSGRWNHTHSTFMQPQSVAARHKGATVQF